MIKNPSLDFDQLRRKEKRLIINGLNGPVVAGGSYGANSNDFATAISILTSASRPPVERFITERLALAALPQRLRDIAANTETGKVLVKIEEKF
jgi:hypothetical protein